MAIFMIFEIAPKPPIWYTSQLHMVEWFRSCFKVIFFKVLETVSCAVGLSKTRYILISGELLPLFTQLTPESPGGQGPHLEMPNPVRWGNHCWLCLIETRIYKD